MILLILFSVIVLALAPFGALAIGTLIIKYTQKSSYDFAVWFMSEVFKDYIYRRKYRWLHYTDFPMALKSDLECLFTDEINKQWEKVLALKSTISQNAGVTDENVAFFSFLIPWNEDNSKTYDQMIANLCGICLTNMKCSTTNVLVDYLDWNIPEYKMCRIRYARTASEQDSLKKLLVKHDLDSLGNTCFEVHDAELDKELSKFGDDKDVSN